MGEKSLPAPSERRERLFPRRRSRTGERFLPALRGRGGKGARKHHDECGRVRGQPQAAWVGTSPPPGSSVAVLPPVASLRWERCVGGRDAAMVEIRSPLGPLYGTFEFVDLRPNRVEYIFVVAINFPTPEADDGPTSGPEELVS